MKIVIDSDTYYPITDGVVRFIDHLGLHLVEKGHEVTFIVPKTPSIKLPPFDYSSRPFKFIRLSTFPLPFKDYYLCFPNRKMIKAISEADVVIVNSMAFSAMYALMINKIFHKKTIHFVHIDEREILYYTAKVPVGIIQKLQNFIKSLSGNVDRFAVATNKFYKRTLRVGVKKSQIFKVPFGYAPKTVSENEVQAYRDKLGIKPGEITVGYLGRLSTEKNVGTLVKVLAELGNKIPNVKTFIGGGGYLYHEISEEIKENNYNITILGKVPEKELPLYYSAIDIFVSPSLHESLGFTVVEAISYGAIPAVNGKFRESELTPEHAILLNDVMNPREIVEQISEVINDQKLMKEMKENVSRIAKNFAWENFDNAWDIELDNLTKTRRPLPFGNA